MAGSMAESVGHCLLVAFHRDRPPSSRTIRSPYSSVRLIGLRRPTEQAWKSTIGNRSKPSGALQDLHGHNFPERLIPTGSLTQQSHEIAILSQPLGAATRITCVGRAPIEFP